MSLVPFDDRDGWIWLDGQFVPWREAKVHVLTHGLHYASSVFEGERMYGGEIFKLTEHTERLFKSAEILDFKIPYTVAEIDEACKATAAKNGLGGGGRGHRGPGLAAPRQVALVRAGGQDPRRLRPLGGGGRRPPKLDKPLANLLFARVDHVARDAADKIAHWVVNGLVYDHAGILNAHV